MILLELAQDNPAQAREIWDSMTEGQRELFKEECEETDSADEDNFQGFLYLISNEEI